MRAFSLASIALLVTACGDKDVTESPEPECGVTIRETFPADGATSAYYRGSVEFRLSDTDTTAVASIEGVEGTSTMNDAGTAVIFTPSSPLAANTSYTAKLSYCTGEASINFTTSNLGQPIDDPSSLAGRVYSLNLQDGRIVIPEGVGSVLEQYLDVTIYIQVTEADQSSITMFGALADEADASHQDYCTQTLDFPSADFSGAPFFAIGPESTTISVAGYTVTIDDLLISGDFAADGSYWGGGVLAGQVDTRPLVDLIEEGGEEDAVCNIVAGFGVSCEPCPADGQPFCLSIRAVDLGGDELTSVSLQEIEQSDCHEMCAESANNPECVL